MKLAIFDIEVLNNVFICCIKILIDRDQKKELSFEISERKNQLSEMIKFFSSGQYVFVGYNCSHYDTVVMNVLISKQQKLISKDYKYITNLAKEASDSIVKKDDHNASLYRKYKYVNYFSQIDIMTMMYSSALRSSLKELQVTMCYHNVEEMEVDWDEDLPKEEIDKLISYCINDVNSTAKVFSILKGEFVLRKNILKEFGINTFSKDGVGIGVDIFTMRICKKLGLNTMEDLYHIRDNYEFIEVKDFLAPIYDFKTEKFKKLYDFYANMVLDADGKLNNNSPSIEFVFDGLKYGFGIGGGHSHNRPEIVQEDKDNLLRDSDGTSYYPSLGEQWGYGPKGFKSVFVEVIHDLKADRVAAKQIGNKTLDKTYKLALNSILGHLRNVHSPYYAPEANLAICINGQLMLCMLVEMCYFEGIKCVSLNTKTLVL